MPSTFTKRIIKGSFLHALLLVLFAIQLLPASSQRSQPQHDSTVKPHAAADSGVHKTNVRPKEITKLEDVNIPQEMYDKIKMMKPNQMVVFRESYTYNIKAEDKIEYSITIKLGFSQDMITGIVKWVPLYASSEAPPEITQIKIPVKFCCTTPIDTLHKKQHCGKMSELNDFEDYEHCKDWIQAEDGGKAGDKPAVFNKKGKGVNATDSTASFGKGEKPSKKDMKKKKGKNGLDVDDATDSTGTAKDSTASYGKPEKPSKKDMKKKKGNDEDIGEPAQQATDSTAAPAEMPKKPKAKEEKKPKKEEAKKDEPAADGDSYGKPQKDSKKKKGKETAPATDSTNYRPEPVMKEEEPTKESSDSTSTSKPDDKKGKKKKKG